MCVFIPLNHKCVILYIKILQKVKGWVPFWFRPDLLEELILHFSKPRNKGGGPANGNIG